jgi:SNF2 family DNA or RNA helicase
MFTGQLRAFQQDAFDMMVEDQRILLAATMGAGKTVITNAVTEHLIETGKAAQGLVIVPSSLKYQWDRKYTEFTDGAMTVVIDGPRPKREKAYRRFAKVGEYCILSYGTAVNDWDILNALDYQFIVVDEVQAIKSPTSQRSQVIKDLYARVEWRYGLTGTPVENKAEEAFSIMEGIAPELFGAAKLFDRTFVVRDNWGNVQKYVNIPLFNKTLKQRMYRVSDRDIEEQLPGVFIDEEMVDFDPASRRLWKYIASDVIADLTEAAEKGMSSFDVEAHYAGKATSKANLALRGRIMSKVLNLRMLADHPKLIEASSGKYSDTTTEEGSRYAAFLQEEGLLSGLPKTSEKYRRAMELLEELTDSGHKVVLFSFFKPTLRWLQADLEKLGVTGVRFDGDMSGKEKDASQQAFLHDPKVRVFLASDAGGQGVDLPVASHLINYNLPWSAGQYLQRNARIRRISSTHKRVFVLNMLVRGSIDVRQYQTLRKKNEAADALVDGIYDEVTAEVDMDVGTLKQYLEDTLKEKN